MPHDEPHEPRLAAALGSRICHDLASPLGALMAGLDLLEMDGTRGPETALMRESVAGARATLDMLRLAFGQVGKGETLDAGKLRAILAAHLAARPRLALDWKISGPMPRADAQRLMLAALCALHALPRGGRLVIAREADGLRIDALGTLAPDRALWDGLAGHRPLPELDPRRIEFHLLARHFGPGHATIVITEAPERLSLLLSQADRD